MSWNTDFCVTLPNIQFTQPIFLNIQVKLELTKCVTLDDTVEQLTHRPIQKF